MNTNRKHTQKTRRWQTIFQREYLNYSCTASSEWKMQDKANFTSSPLRSESDARNAIGAFLEVALLESDVFPVVDKACGPVVVVFETEPAVQKTDIPDVAEVPCVRRYSPYVAWEPLVVFCRVR